MENPYLKLFSKKPSNYSHFYVSDVLFMFTIDPLINLLQEVVNVFFFRVPFWQKGMLRVWFGVSSNFHLLGCYFWRINFSIQKLLFFPIFTADKHFSFGNSFYPDDLPTFTFLGPTHNISLTSSHFSHSSTLSVAQALLYLAQACDSTTAHFPLFFPAQCQLLGLPIYSLLSAQTCLDHPIVITHNPLTLLTSLNFRGGGSPLSLLLLVP